MSEDDMVSLSKNTACGGLGGGGSSTLTDHSKAINLQHVMLSVASLREQMAEAREYGMENDSLNDEG
jgi:hypothetical protein